MRGSRCPPSARASAAATSIWPRWPRSAWMRASNGVSEPLAASVESAPVTSAAWNTRSIANSPASASAVENCVPLSRASPSFGPSTIGASPARASASAAGMRSPASRHSPTPDHRRRHMRERREIAGRADRALARDHRDHAARQHGFEHARPCRSRTPGGAAAEARELQRHHQPHDAPAASARRRRRRARARYCAGAWRDRRPRCARWRACRSRC